MSICRKKRWYIATIGGLSACSRDRLEAQRLVLIMYTTANAVRGELVEP